MNSYIIVGILNTIIGYLIGVIMFYILKDDFNNLQIAILINFITIFIAYFNYRFFHFKSKKSIPRELFKFYFTYLIAASINVALFSVFLDNGFNIWVTQIFLILTSFCLTFLLNNFFVFRKL